MNITTDPNAPQTGSTISQLGLPTASVSAPVATAQPQFTANMGQLPKKRMPINMIVGLVVLALVLIGSGAALFLSQMNQDVRNQASTVYKFGPCCKNGVTTDSPISECVSQGGTPNVCENIATPPPTGSGTVCTTTTNTAEWEYKDGSCKSKRTFFTVVK